MYQTTDATDGSGDAGALTQAYPAMVPQVTPTIGSAPTLGALTQAGTGNLTPEVLAELQALLASQGAGTQYAYTTADGQTWHPTYTGGGGGSAETGEAAPWLTGWMQDVVPGAYRDDGSGDMQRMYDAAGNYQGTAAIPKNTGIQDWATMAAMLAAPFALTAMGVAGAGAGAGAADGLNFAQGFTDVGTAGGALDTAYAGAGSGLDFSSGFTDGGTAGGVLDPYYSAGGGGSGLDFSQGYTDAGTAGGALDTDYAAGSLGGTGGASYVGAAPAAPGPDFTHGFTDNGTAGGALDTDYAAGSLGGTGGSISPVTTTTETLPRLDNGGLTAETTQLDPYTTAFNTQSWNPSLTDVARLGTAITALTGGGSPAPAPGAAPGVAPAPAPAVYYDDGNWLPPGWQGAHPTYRPGVDAVPTGWLGAGSARLMASGGRVPWHVANCACAQCGGRV